jgi:Protein of unknown function (DUF5132)
MSEQSGNSRSKVTLSKKSINALADELEARRRQTNQGTKEDDGPKQYGRGQRGRLFFWGALSGVAFAAAAPMLGRQARPAVRGLIKGGIKASRYFQQVASSMKEEVEDIAAEAKAELNPETEQ